ncbi:MAG: carboxypeptidase regulatory-like domain-containing protein [Bryobacteraceae bacterium]
MKKLLLALGICLFFGLGLFGQSASSLAGTVTDPSGAMVPGATIVLADASTGAQRETVSDGSGRYSFAQVQPGTYHVTAKAKGFNDVVVSNVELLVNSPATLPIAFTKVGSVNETVAVQAETVEVNTSDASLGNAIGTRPITQLPFEGRNVVGLLSIQPGVLYLGEPAPGTTGDYRSGSVNGGKPDQANVTLDGVDVNDQQSRTAFTSVLRVTLDSVQEFRTITTNSGAELGRTSGAQVALITKSGTNTIHGSLYEYLRNTLTSANTFFNNEFGIPRQKLNRNVFGVSAGGPIKKNKLFYFLNWEGRRDASEGSVVRTVPNKLFRQGIFTYLTTSNQMKQLTPADIKAIDPAGIGVNPAVLKTLQSYPLPNDTTAGDALNTSGYRFNSSTPLRWNTYIAKFDYRLNDNHQIFWRGNLQNDNFANGLPQFPGDPNSTVLLENSKGYAIGYTGVLKPTLVNSFHFGYTRQGTQTTGVQTTAVDRLRGITDIHAITDGLTRIIPVYTIGDDLVWTKGAHSVSFGAIARVIRNNRTSYATAFSDALANADLLNTGGKEFLTADAKNTSNYKRQFTNLLGLMSQLTGQFNFDLTGKVLPEGTPVFRKFADEEYEMYAQDSWKVTRGFTVTAGLRFSLLPPIYEQQGYQTSANIPLGQWFDMRGGLADQGKPQSLVPRITYNLASAPGGRPLYDTQRDWAPRLALAYSPQASGGISKFLFGGPGKSSIRAGFGMFYDLFGETLIRSQDATALGFSTSLTNPPAGTALNLPRYAGFTAVPFSSPVFPKPPASTGFPQTQPDIFQITNGVDDHLRSPYIMDLDFSVGREFSHGFFVQGSYVGRLSRHSLIRDDLAEPTNLKDPKSGQTYFQAASMLADIINAHPNASSAKDLYQFVPKIPFWEDLWSGAAGNGLTATQAIFAQYFNAAPDYTTALSHIDVPGSNGKCNPACSDLGPYALFNSQYSALGSLRSRGGGDYHAMQWTVRKRFSNGIQFDLNYTYSKSIDLGSVREASTSNFSAVILNSWSPQLNKGVSDYDTTHLVSAFWVAELPFGKGKRFLGGSNRFVDEVLGGWQLSGIWRQSSGLPVSVSNGAVYPTNWEIGGWATQVGPAPVPQTSKNAPAVSGAPGPNLFPNPTAALASYGFTSPGGAGQRNGLRGDGFFTIDAGLSKRFYLFTLRDQPHTLQFRAEAFNVTNSVRFDVNTIDLSLTDPNNFGKYTTTLTNPRAMQFSLRYEF